METIYKLMEDISITSQITYKTIDSVEQKLDIYYPAKKLGKEPWEEISEQTKPTLVYFHGGGWVSGDRISRSLAFLPYLEKGWCVVNVDYRLLQETSLIGCLNDCIDAINWVNENSSTYKFDTDQIYLSGESAGGHLALLAGMIDEFELDGHQLSKRKGAIKGIINWYGITETKGAIEFWNDEGYTNLILDKWEGNSNSYLEYTSPINHISQQTTPPIISFHGNRDINVEYEQATLLHEKLEASGIKNKLVTIEGKKHGDFSANDLESIFTEIWSFLK